MCVTTLKHNQFPQAQGFLSASDSAEISLGQMLAKGLIPKNSMSRCTTSLLMAVLKIGDNHRSRKTWVPSSTQSQPNAEKPVGRHRHSHQGGDGKATVGSLALGDAWGMRVAGQLGWWPPPAERSGVFNFATKPQPSATTGTLQPKQIFFFN